MNHIINITKKHIMNFPGKRLDNKIVVIQSEDRGSKRITSIEGLKYDFMWN